MTPRQASAAVALVLGVRAQFVAAGAESAQPVLDEAGVLRAVPGIRIRSIRPVPLQGGLYEVIDDRGAAFYLDGAAGIGFQCDLFDVATRRNLTQESLARFGAVDFAELPIDLAITRVKGDGRRRMAVFADPDCPYCSKLEQELDMLDNVTIHTFLYPIVTLHPLAVDRARRIWCSADRDAAWLGWLLHQREPAPAADVCASPVDEIARIAPSFRINGTPSLVFESGRVVSGFVPGTVLESYLEEPSLLPAGDAADAGR